MSGFTDRPTLSEVLAEGNSTGGNDIDFTSTNGATTVITHSEQLLSGLSGGTATATGIFPAGVIRLGATVRVTTVITGTATDFDVGDGSDVDIFGAAISKAATTTTSDVDFTANPTTSWSSAAGNVVLTANGGTFTTGAVRVVAHYIEMAGPTS
jgi:hypothetical protein